MAARPREQHARGHHAEASPTSLRVIWPALGLAALTVAVYAGVWSFSFVQFDDPQYVTANPHIAGGLTWSGIRWAFAAGYALNWHPVTWLSHMLDIQMFGLQAGPAHAVNLLLHVLNTLLLFWFLASTTRAPGRSAVVAALFAVHPLHVESVAWVSERKDVLSTCFWMLTLVAYVRYVKQPSGMRYLAVAGFTALGLMAKPMLVTLPFVLLLVDWWPLGRVRGVRWSHGSLDPGIAPGSEDPGLHGSRRRWSPGSWVRSSPGSLDPGSWWPLVREKWLLFALAAASSVATLAAQRAGGAVVRLEVMPMALRVETALVSYASYLVKMIWPVDLYMYYPHAVAIPDGQTAASVAFLIAVTAIVIVLRRHQPYAAVGWLWYLGTLVPVIGLVQVGRQAMADRYTYVPLIGIFTLLVWGTAEVFGRSRLGKGLAVALATVAIAASAVTARAQVQHWRNDSALWQHALRVAMGLDERRTAMAVEYLLAENNLVPLQTLLFSQAGGSSVFPPLAHQYVAQLFARHDQVDDAIAEYEEALRLKPDFDQAHQELGVLLASHGKVDLALPHLVEAVRLRPDRPEAHRNLAVAFAQLGRTAEATKELREVLRLRPDDAEVRRALEAYDRRAGRSGK